MAKYRVMVRETYMMVHETDTPAVAAEKAMECMSDHPDQHLFAQEVQIIPMDDEEEETEWGKLPQSKEMH